MNFNKCILCGLCVRVCDEVVGAAALGLVARGFNAGVKTALEADLREAGCISCGLCVHACPTGALGELQPIPKQVPVREKLAETTCAWCSVGCRQKLASAGGKLLRSVPAADRPGDALLCMRGRFGFGEIARNGRILKPLIRRGNGFEEITFAEAAVYANKSMQAAAARYGKDAIAVAVSDRYTNEEIAFIKFYANNALGTDKAFSFSRFESGLADVAGRDASTATFDEMESADIIVLAGANLMSNHAVAGMRVRRAVRNGAKLILIGGDDKLLPNIAAMKIETGDDLNILRQLVKALIDKDAGKNIPGHVELASHLSGVTASGEAARAAGLLLKAKKVVYIYEKETLTRDAARLVSDIALLCGHLRGARNGVIQISRGANAQGLADLGIAPGEVYRAQVESGEIRGLFIFGEDIEGLDTSKLDVLAVQDLHRTTTVKKANVVFPASSYAEVSGTYTSADGCVRGLKKVVDCPIAINNGKQAALLSALARASARHRGPGEMAGAVLAESLVPPDGNAMTRGRVPVTNELYAGLMKYVASNKL
jgi:formate dehydrogenase major subunit